MSQNLPNIDRFLRRDTRLNDKKIKSVTLQIPPVSTGGTISTPSLWESSEIGNLKAVRPEFADPTIVVQNKTLQKLVKQQEEELEKRRRKIKKLESEVEVLAARPKFWPTSSTGLDPVSGKQGLPYHAPSQYQSDVSGSNPASFRQTSIPDGPAASLRGPPASGLKGPPSPRSQALVHANRPATVNPALQKPRSPDAGTSRVTKIVPRGMSLDRSTSPDVNKMSLECLSPGGTAVGQGRRLHFTHRDQHQYQTESPTVGGGGRTLSRTASPTANTSRPGTSGKVTLNKDVQADGWRWVRFFFPKYNDKWNPSSENAFYQHFDVNVDNFPHTFGVEELEQHDDPSGGGGLGLESSQNSLHDVQLACQNISWKWERLLFTKLESWRISQPLHQSYSSTPSVSGEMDGNMLESVNFTRRADLHRLIGVVSGLRNRVPDDLAPLCALQAGLLHFLYHELDAIGEAAEARHRVREEHLIRQFNEQMAEMQHNLEQTADNTVGRVVTLKKVVDKFKRKSIMGGGLPVVEKVMNLEQENEDLKEQNNILSSKVGQLMVERQTQDKEIRELEGRFAQLMENDSQSHQVTDTLEAILEGLSEESIHQSVHSSGEETTDLNVENIVQHQKKRKGSLKLSRGLKEVAEDLEKRITTVVLEIHDARKMAAQARDRMELLTLESAKDQVQISELSLSLAQQKKIFSRRSEEAKLYYQEREKNAVASLQAQLNLALQEVEENRKQYLESKMKKAYDKVMANSRIMGKTASQARLIPGNEDEDETAREKRMIAELQDEILILQAQAKAQAAEFRKTVRDNLEKQTAMHGTMHSLIQDFKAVSNSCEGLEGRSDYHANVNEGLMAQLQKLENQIQAGETKRVSVHNVTEESESERVEKIGKLKSVTEALVFAIRAKVEDGGLEGKAASDMLAVANSFRSCQAEMTSLEEEVLQAKEKSKTLRAENLHELKRIRILKERLPATSPSGSNEPSDDSLPPSSKLDAELDATLSLVGATENNESHLAAAPVVESALNKNLSLVDDDSGPVSRHGSGMGKDRHLPPRVQKMVNMLTSGSGGGVLNSIDLNADVIAAFQAMDRAEAAKVLEDVNPAKVAKLATLSKLETSAGLLALVSPKLAADVLVHLRPGHFTTDLILLIQVQRRAGPILEAMRADLRSDFLAALPEGHAGPVVEDMRVQFSAEAMGEMLPATALPLLLALDPVRRARVVAGMSQISTSLLLQHASPREAGVLTQDLHKEELATVLACMSTPKVEQLLRTLSPLSALKILIALPAFRVGCIAQMMDAVTINRIHKALTELLDHVASLHSAMIPCLVQKDNPASWMADWRRKYEELFGNRRASSLQAAEDMEAKLMKDLGLMWLPEFQEMSARMQQREQHRVTVHTAMKSVMGFTGDLQRFVRETNQAAAAKGGISGTSQAELQKTARDLQANMERLNLQSKKVDEIGSAGLEEEVEKAMDAVQRSFDEVQSLVQDGGVAQAGGDSDAIRDQWADMMSMHRQVSQTSAKMRSSTAALRETYLASSSSKQIMRSDVKLTTTVDPKQEDGTDSQDSEVKLPENVQLETRDKLQEISQDVQALIRSSNLLRRASVDSQALTQVGDSLELWEALDSENPLGSLSATKLRGVCHTVRKALGSLHQAMQEKTPKSQEEHHHMKKEREAMQLLEQRLLSAESGLDSAVEAAKPWRLSTQGGSFSPPRAGLAEHHGSSMSQSGSVKDFLALPQEVSSPTLWSPDKSPRQPGNSEVSKKFFQKASVANASAVRAAMREMKWLLETSQQASTQKKPEVEDLIKEVKEEMDAFDSEVLPTCQSEEIDVRKVHSCFKKACMVANKATLVMDKVIASKHGGDKAELASMTRMGKRQLQYLCTQVNSYEAQTEEAIRDLLGGVRNSVTLPSPLNHDQPTLLLDPFGKSEDSITSDMLSLSSEDGAAGHREAPREDTYIFELFKTTGLWRQVSKLDDVEELATQAMDFLHRQYSVHSTFNQLVVTADDEDTADAVSPRMHPKHLQALYTTLDHKHHDAEVESDSPAAPVSIEIRDEQGTEWGTVVFHNKPRSANPEGVRQAQRDMDQFTGGIQLAVQIVNKRADEAIERMRAHNRLMMKRAVYMATTINRVQGGVNSTELTTELANIRQLKAARKKVEKLLGSPAMLSTFREIRHYRKPKRAVVATVIALLLLSKHDPRQMSLPPDAILPTNENALHKIWLNIQKQMGPKVLQHMVDTDCHDSLDESIFTTCTVLMEGVHYKELKNISQASGLIHEWIWLVIKLHQGYGKVKALRENL